MADKIPQMSRRDFLVAGVKGLASAAVLPTASKFFPNKEQTVRPDDNLNGITIHYSESGLPSTYEVSGQIHQFTGEETANMAAAIQAAKKEKVPKLLYNIVGEQVPPPPDVWQPTPDRPYVRDIPKDILNNDRLKAIGVKVFQGQNGIEFYFTDAAVKEGGVLYKLSQDQKNSTDPLTLEVLVVDAGPYLALAFMPSEKYPKEALDIIAPPKENLLVYRDAQVLKLRQQIQELTPNIQSTRNEIIDLTRQIGDWQNATEQELELASNNQHLVAFYAPAKSHPDSKERIGYLFLAVGENPNRYHVSLLSDENGNIFPVGSTGIGKTYGTLSPRESTGFPRPSDFTRLPNAGENGGYVYAPKLNQPGQAIKHELGHMDNIDLNDNPDIKESTADSQAMSETSAEYQDWQRRIDSYPFVIVNKKTKEIQVTKRQPTHIRRQH